MKTGALLAALLTASSAIAQDAEILSSFDYARVEIGGALNMRDGPSTESDRISRIESGEVVRVVTCQSRPEQDWCEVETAVGDQEGWVAARFLRPYHGADPSALEMYGLSPDERRSVERPGKLNGQLAQGGIVDLVVSLPPDALLVLDLDASSGIRLGTFGVNGEPLVQGDASSNTELVLPDGGDVLIRIADMSGNGGDWILDVRIE